VKIADCCEVKTIHRTAFRAILRVASLSGGDFAGRPLGNVRG
jgi:hypothetical protein